MYYIGFLKKDAKHAMVFKSLITNSKYMGYFVKVIGPYPTEEEANITLGNFKKAGCHCPLKPQAQPFRLIPISGQKH